MKTKLEFLKQYISSNDNTRIDIEDAFNLLAEFYDTLPKRAKTKEREMTFCCVADLFRDALETQLKELANCPFVKIEIYNQEQELKDKKTLEWCKNSICVIGGYLDGKFNSEINLNKLK